MIDADGNASGDFITDDGNNRDYRHDNDVPQNYVHVTFKATLASKKITIDVNKKGAGSHEG